MKQPTPLQFTKTLMALVFPAIIGFIIFLVFVACRTIEPMYRISGNEMTMEYFDKKGNYIIVPLNTNECEGYSKPYHIITYNN